MKSDEELPVIRAWYEFTLWFIPKMQKFPRDQKFLLGDKLQSLSLGVLDRLIEAKYRRDRVAVLDQANVELEKLRFHLRLAHDLKLITTRTYGSASSRIGEVGAQVGGWKRSTASRDDR